MRIRLLFAALLVSAAGCGGSSADPDAGPDGCVGTECAPDPCAELACPDPAHLCVVEGESARCQCPAGTHADGDRCAEDVTCQEMTCGPAGLCDDSMGAIECTCPDGYEGARCEECGAGYRRDAEGRCDANLCEPNPCTEPERARCEEVDDAAGFACRCNAGSHDEDGMCVPDLTCTMDTCAGRGACTDTADGPACACDAGFAGRFCDGCDEAGGYHADGAGGCTMDVCLPDPCTAPPFVRCVAGPDGPECECALGTHRDGDACLPDEVCASDSCGGHGLCSVAVGRIECACDPAYEGDRCESCAAGFHDDGAGGCTMDVCLPDPCTEPNRGICSEASPGVAQCDCDPGYHEDGVGGCTMDVCLPHPCGAQACRVDATGAAECYTPLCDDSNPCTDDAYVGRCVFTPVADGTPCSTTACTSDQTCNRSTCGGGTMVVCDDGDACTVDSCDDITGCDAVVDMGLVPDDGVSCTVDSCSGGVESHTPTDARCDDGLYCTGTERCDPSATGADANGCRVEGVPVPPPSSPCRSYVCDEGTMGFEVQALAAGAPCNDGLSCTAADVCVAEGGACAGTVVGGCVPGGSCASAVPWSSVIDIPSAAITGTITVDGSPPPATVSFGDYGTSYLWAISRATGVRHRLGRLQYTSTVSGVGYRLTTGDAEIDARLVPGIYDVIYARNDNLSSTNGDRYVNTSETATPLPAGWQVVRADVVLGPGANTLNVDIPSAAITGVITVDGSAPPATVSFGDYGTSYLWAISQATGVRHRLGRLQYTSTVSGVGYRLTTGDAQIDARLVPGTYDVIYARNDNLSSTNGDRYVNTSETSTPLPAGWQVVQSGVVLTAGANTLNVDVPSAAVTGVITVDGSAPPATVSFGDYGTSYLWAISQATGVRHRLGRLQYTSTVSGVGYRLTTGDAQIDARLVPGTYDVIYARNDNLSSSNGDRYVNTSETSTPLPAGWQVVQSGVVLTAGANTLNVDVPSAAITGVITVDGSAPPATVSFGDYGTSYLWAISQATGVRHRLGRLQYTSTVSGVGYRLTTGDEQIDARLVPGTYDVIYARNDNLSSSNGDRYVNTSETSTPLPAGWQVVQSGVVLTAGANTLNVNVPSAAIAGVITVDGSAPPATVSFGDYGTSYLWAISQATGVRHRLGRLQYTSTVSGVGYRLTTGDAQIDARLVPGTYDVIYARNDNLSSTNGDRYVNTSETSTPLPAGWQVVQSGVVLTAGANTLNVNVPSAALLGLITVDGAAPPATVSFGDYGTSYLWAISEATGVRHRLGRLQYTSTVSGVGYRLTTGDEQIDARLVPGNYHLIYARNDNISSTNGDRYVNTSETSTPLPAGWQMLQACVAIP